MDSVTNTHTDNPDLDSVINKYITRESFAGSVNRIRHEMKQDLLKMLARECSAENSKTSAPPLCEVSDCSNQASHQDSVNSGRFKIPVCSEHYAEKHGASTKSSGELEEILKIIDQYSIHKPRGQAKGTLARRELKKRIRKLHTTQTTKLQVEARLDELRHLSCDETGIWYKAYHSDHLELQTLDERIAELEREHKIGEDRENP